MEKAHPHLRYIVNLAPALLTKQVSRTTWTAEFIRVNVLMNTHKSKRQRTLCMQHHSVCFLYYWVIKKSVHEARIVRTEACLKPRGDPLPPFTRSLNPTDSKSRNTVVDGIGQVLGWTGGRIFAAAAHPSYIAPMSVSLCSGHVWLREYGSVMSVLQQAFSYSLLIWCLVRWESHLLTSIRFFLLLLSFFRFVRLLVVASIYPMQLVA